LHTHLTQRVTGIRERRENEIAQILCAKAALTVHSSVNIVAIE